MTKGLDDLTDEQLQWMAANAELIEQVLKLHNEEIQKLAREDPSVLMLLLRLNESDSD